MIFTSGANDIAAAADTRYLTPGWSPITATTTVFEIRATASVTFFGMRVRHNTPSADPTTIDYRLRVNGVDTALVVTLAGNAFDGSNLVDDASVDAGDLVALVAVKGIPIATGLLNVIVTFEAE